MSGHSHDNHGKNGPGYEVSDAHVPVILKSGAGIFVLVAFSFGLMFLAFQVLGSLRHKLESGPEPTQMQMRQGLPNAPLLQVDQTLELKVQRKKDAELLGSYGKNEKTGGIHIPIDRAIDILAERGLPEPKGNPQPAETAPAPAAKGKK